MKESVSVVIPFFSHIDWLDTAINSVINQTVLPQEIIVINDGSKENLDDIKNKYPMVKWIDKLNSGAGPSRNLGIQISTSDIIMFLDSDDIWEKEKIELQVKYMKNNNYKWCSTAYTTFGTDISKVIKPFYYNGLIWEHMYNSSKVQTSTVAVYKSILNNKENFADNMKNGQDVFLWFKLSTQHIMGVIEQPLVKYRIHGNNVHMKVSSHIRVRAMLWEKMHEEKNFKLPRSKLTILGYKICYWIYIHNNQIVRDNLVNKVLFSISWIMFRISNYIIDKKLK